MPRAPAPGPLPLVDRSFVQVLGRYEMPAEEKIFLADTGNLAIDSLTTTHLFASIDATYRNREGKPLSYSGQFKVRIAD
jgi:hypothetical protein